MTVLRYLCRPLCVVAAACFSLTVAGYAAPPIRILPLGDSITYGADNTGSHGGYRLPLYHLLTDAGYNVDFVGTQTSNGDAALPDSDHEGHSGWRIDQIDGIILDVFDSIDDPDVILVLIGTNDYGQNHDPLNATNRLDALIGKITSDRPFAKVILSNLTVRGEPLNTSIQNTFNPYVPIIVDKYAAMGRQVYFTDLYDAVPLSDMPDNLHPNGDGYTKMATNWFERITEHFSPEGSTNAPAIAHLTGQPTLTRIVVTFSKPVADNACVATNYSVSGGVTVLAAELDAASQRVVTLTTSVQTPLTLYTLTASNVTDRTLAATPIDPTASSGSFVSTAARGAPANVPEAAEYRLLYSLDIPAEANYLTGATYDADLHDSVTNFTRVAYYLELQPVGGELQYIWVSMDPITDDTAKIGVPTVPCGAIFQQDVTNMTVVSSEATIVQGTNLAGGNIEFWPSNYQEPNDAAVPNASDTVFDFGDRRSAGTYGSMQLHNHDARQTLFAFNRWGGTPGAVCLGIGNCPSSANTDWTHVGNGADYTIKLLQVYVKTGETNPAPRLVGARPGEDRFSVTVTFNVPVDDSATNTAFYALDGGLDVLAATIDQATPVNVLLRTTPQASATVYTLTVNGVTDRTPAHHPVPADSMTTFTSLTALLRGATNNVTEAADYQLVYSLDIPNTPNYAGGVAYTIDRHAQATNFTRIGYYLELQKEDGPLDYVWVSVDRFTTNAAMIGVPTVPSGAIFQQALSNMTVVSSVAGIVAGTNLTGGNIEFWPSNYNAVNAKSVPYAGGGAYDFGDNATVGNYGSMQLHNHDARQVLLAFNRWGGAGGNADLGIGNRPNSTDIDWTFAQNAAGYAVKTLEIYVKPLTPGEAPVLMAAAQAGPAWVAVTFSRPVDDNATNAANYALDGGLTVVSAAINPVNRSGVTLTTSPPLVPGTHYTLTVNDVRNLSSDHLPVAADSSVSFRVPYLLGVFSNVAEASDYTLIYTLPVPNRANFRGTNSPPYTLDHCGRILHGYDRVAYYLELDANDGTGPRWVYASMDDFAGGAVRALGLPHAKDNPVAHQQIVNNMNIFAANGSGIVTGTGLATGNLEMWPGNYGVANAKGIPNASDTVLDFGDSNGGGIGPGHGSFQLHNHGADLGDSTGQVLFAYNDWGGSHAGEDGELGIGNSTGTHPDWTFQNTAGGFVVKNFQILVRETPRGPDPLDALRRKTGLALKHYELAYALDIPNGRLSYNSQPIGYALNRSGQLAPGLARIAYYLELGAGATTNWVLVSMDAFTPFPRLTGVPSSSTYGNDGTHFQQLITNMDVVASAGAGVTTGTDIQTGNIEFWNSSYSAPNAVPITNADNTHFDFGDVAGTGNGYACMQIHNHDIDGDGPGTAGQTIFAFNDWGGNTSRASSDLGIGNRPGSLDTDWTFAANADGYTRKHLEVLVLPSVYANVPEADSFAIAYALDIPNDEYTLFHTRGVPYTIDRSLELAGKPFRRVAYYLELKKPGKTTEWVYVSMDAFTDDIALIGVPVADTGVRWQMNVTHMNVYASTNAPVTTGENLATGSLEFWPNNYGQANEAGVPGASATTYDFGDDVSETVVAGHGSMQVSNWGEGQVVFAYNGWGATTSVGGLGIGNQPTGHPDWTFSEAARSYEVKTLMVLVDVPPDGTLLLVR